MPVKDSAALFEETLVSDDLFLSYFDAYLRLPIFSEKLCYNRLTGEFKAVHPRGFSDTENTIYGLGDQERETLIRWAKLERYDPFVRSDYFRELKLCKLLRRPTEYIPPGEEVFTPKLFEDLFGSGKTSAARGLTGVSRQSSITQETESTEECSETTEDSELIESSAGSQETYSDEEQVPDYLWIKEDDERRRDHAYGKYFKIRRQTIVGSSVKASSSSTESSLNGKTTGSIKNLEKNRRMSEPINFQPDVFTRGVGQEADEAKQHVSNVSKAAGYTSRPNEFEASTDDSWTLTTEKELAQRLQDFEQRQHIPVQRLKELLLSSYEGMRDFISFLVPTKGINLVEFWLDCEATTMRVADLPVVERLKTKFQLLRQLEERYFLKITPKVRRHLGLAIDTLSTELLNSCSRTEDEVTHKLGELMFERIQYDSLRRLRSYWLPCWILHWENRLKRCQFLPSIHGGCELFYIPLKKPTHARFGIRNESSKQSFSRILDDNFHELPDAEDDEEWSNEVYEQILRKALSGKGLISVKENKKLLKNANVRRMQITTSSSLSDFQEVQAQIFSYPLNLVTPIKMNGGRAKSIFEEICLGATLPCEPPELFESVELAQSTEGTTDQLKRKLHNMGGLSTNVQGSLVLQPIRSKPNLETGKSISVEEAHIYRILLMDSAAGGPLQLYLERQNLIRECNALKFVQSVQQFSRQNYCSMLNRPRRLENALHILQTFLLPGSPCDIEMPADLVQGAKMELQVKRYQVNEHAFAYLIRACLDLLKPAWIKFLKYDAFEYAKASHRHYDGVPPPQSIDEFDVIFTGTTILVNRKYPDLKEKEDNLAAWAKLSAEERKLNLRIALEKRRMMERERKMAIKSALRRQRDEQLAKRGEAKKIGIRRISQNEITEGHDQTDITGEGSEMGEERISMRKFLSSKMILKNFQLWLADKLKSQNNMKDQETYKLLLQQLDYVIESSRLLALSTKRMTTENIERRSRMAESLYQKYLKKGAHHRIPITNKHVVKLSTEKGLPSNETLRGIRDEQVPDLDPHFLEFLKFLADKFGITISDLKEMSEEDLFELLDAQEDTTLKKGSDYLLCRAHPTAEDIAAFEAMLASVAFRPLTFEVILFYQFLVTNARRRGESLADQDFIFCIESVRYQELCRGGICNSVLKKKAQCILLTFVDTPFVKKIQVDLPPSFSNHLIQQIRHPLENRSTVPSDIFEEAKYKLTQEVLPFWAGFRRKVFSNNKSTQKPPFYGNTIFGNVFRIPTFSQQTRNHSGIRLDYSLPELPEENRANMINFSVKHGAKWGYQEE